MMKYIYGCLELPSKTQPGGASTMASYREPSYNGGANGSTLFCDSACRYCIEDFTPVAEILLVRLLVRPGILLACQTYSAN